MPVHHRLVQNKNTNSKPELWQAWCSWGQPRRGGERQRCGRWQTSSSSANTNGECFSVLGISVLSGHHNSRVVLSQMSQMGRAGHILWYDFNMVELYVQSKLWTGLPSSRKMFTRHDMAWNVWHGHTVVSHHCLISGPKCRSEDRFGHVIWPLPASSSRIRRRSGKGAGRGRRHNRGHYYFQKLSFL